MPDEEEAHASLTLEPDELAFEVDAPGVHPASAPTSALLAAAAAYFALVERDATLAGQPVTFRGLEVVDKCIAMKSHAGSGVAARAAVVRVSRYLTGEVRPPSGLKLLTDRTREAMEELGADFRFRSHVGRWTTEIRTTAEGTDRPLDAQIAIRATLLRIGGRSPVARFESQSEPGRPFSLKTQDTTARELAEHLYREVDIVARVERSSVGEITDGELLEFAPLEDPGPRGAFEAWRDWFRANASDWNRVDDVEGDLRGD